MYFATFHTFLPLGKAVEGWGSGRHALYIGTQERRKERRRQEQTWATGQGGGQFGWWVSLGVPPYLPFPTCQFTFPHLCLFHLYTTGHRWLRSPNLCTPVSDKRVTEKIGSGHFLSTHTYTQFTLFTVHILLPFYYTPYLYTPARTFYLTIHFTPPFTEKMDEYSLQTDVFSSRSNSSFSVGVLEENFTCLPHTPVPIPGGLSHTTRCTCDFTPPTHTLPLVA